MKVQVAIVLGGYASALGTLQALGSRGIRCWVLHTHRSAVTHTRYARYRRIPDPRQDEAGALGCLLGDLGDHGFGRQ